LEYVVSGVPTGQGGSDNRWQGYSHQELYDMLNSGPGGRAAGVPADAWSGLSGALADIQQDIATGVANSGATWEGDAADSARGALGPLGDWAQQASAAAELMQISTATQGELLGKARVDMPAPYPAPQPGDLSPVSQLLSAQVDHEIAEAMHDAAAQRAFQVMGEYETGTTDNTSTLGEFGQPPKVVVDSSAMVGMVPEQVRSVDVGLVDKPTTALPRTGATEEEPEPAVPEREPDSRPPAVYEPAASDEPSGSSSAAPAEPAPELTPTGRSVSIPTTDPSSSTTISTGSTGPTGTVSVGEPTPGPTTEIPTPTGTAEPVTTLPAPASGGTSVPVRRSGGRDHEPGPTEGPASGGPAPKPTAPGSPGSAGVGQTTTTSAAASQAPAAPVTTTKSQADAVGTPLMPAPRTQQAEEDRLHSSYLILGEDIYGDQGPIASPVIGEDDEF
jgi:hypothetical protein